MLTCLRIIAIRGAGESVLRKCDYCEVELYKPLHVPLWRSVRYSCQPGDIINQQCPVQPVIHNVVKTHEEVRAYEWVNVFGYWIVIKYPIAYDWILIKYPVLCHWNYLWIKQVFNVLGTWETCLFGKENSNFGSRHNAFFPVSLLLPVSAYVHRVMADRNTKSPLGKE